MKAMQIIYFRFLIAGALSSLKPAIQRTDGREMSSKKKKMIALSKLELEAIITASVLVKSLAMAQLLM